MVRGTLKIGLYTRKEDYIQIPVAGIPAHIGQHIDTTTGMYLSPAYPLDGTPHIYRFHSTWDFDDKVNPNQALDDARHFVEYLTKQGIPLTDLIPFASGRKGVHIVGRHLLPPRSDWFEIFAHAADRKWKHQFPTLDTGIYKNRALIRAPWSCHAAVNARKKPLPPDLFWRGDWSDIKDWAQQPLTDAQYADIEALIRECLPSDEPTPAYWTSFSDHLVLDFRQHSLTQKAILAAKSIHYRPRFDGDWGTLLDEAGIDHRQRKSRRGTYYQIRECPYCHRKDKAYITKSGNLRCFRTGCEAHDGIPANIWTEYLGLHLDEPSPETDTVEPTIRHNRPEHLPSAMEASAELHQKLERLHNLPPGIALLVMTTPGIGKTTHALEHVRQFWSKVIVATSTKQRARELYEQYGGDDAQLIEGRCEANCQNFERIQIVSVKGYLPGKVVCPGCPFFPKNAQQEGVTPCAYYEQLRHPARVTFCTYEQALYLHEADRLEADLIVLDEDPSRAFMQKREIQFPHLMFTHQGLEQPVRRFVNFLQHTLLIATEDMDGKFAIFRGRLLADLIRLSADQLGIDLLKLLGQVQNCISNVYNRPTRLAKTEIEVLEHIPPAYLEDLAATIRRELSHEEDEWNSPLSIGVKNGVATLNFYQRFKMEMQTPLVILDAYGRQEYYQALLNRPVETIQVDAAIHAKVINIKLATSKRAFRARHDALFRRLDEVIEHHQGRKILIYTHAAHEDEVQQRYPSVATQHFWDGRGRDEFKNYDVGIIFGTAEPNPQALIDECRALHADDPIPISGEPLPQNHRHRKDERLETLLLMRREEEMEQAAHRLRPVWAQDNPKVIIVMSHLELPGLPPDEVVDPRAIESQRRKDCLSEFITDCLDKMGFYFDGLAEIGGIVESKSKHAQEFRQRLDCTDSRIKSTIRQSVQPLSEAGSLYPANRNAFYRDRDVVLDAIELPSENVTFELAGTGKATIKVWGNVEAAQAWLNVLVSDGLESRKPFTLEDLLEVCERYEIEMEILLRAVPTADDAYYRLFNEGATLPTTSASAVTPEFTSDGVTHVGGG